jgi:hypothetical protein
MKVLLPIGDFSRMTYLSVKALRHYEVVLTSYSAPEVMSCFVLPPRTAFTRRCPFRRAHSFSQWSRQSEPGRDRKEKQVPQYAALINEGGDPDWSDLDTP